MSENKKNRKQSLIDFINKNSEKFIIATIIVAGIGLAAIFGLVWAYRNVAAVVDNQLIYKSQIERQLTLNKNVARVENNNTNTTYTSAKKQVIDIALIKLAASEYNISVSDQDIQNEIANMADSHYNGSTALLYQSYYQSYGYEQSEFQDMIRNYILYKKVDSQLIAGKTGTAVYASYQPDQDSLSYNKMTASQLEAWAKQEADAWHGELKSGESFASLVNDLNNKQVLLNPALGILTFNLQGNDILNQAETNLISSVKPGQYSTVSAVSGQYYAIYYVNPTHTNLFASMDDLISYYNKKYKNTISISMKLSKFSIFNRALATCSHGLPQIPCSAISATPTYVYCLSDGGVGATCWATCSAEGLNCTLGKICCSASGGGGGGNGGYTPPPPQPVNGRCGSAAGDSFLNKPNAGLCSAGSPSSVSTSGDKWVWTCHGANNGSDKSCSATALNKLKVVVTGCPTAPNYDAHVRVVDTATLHKIQCKPDKGASKPDCVADLTKNSDITLKPVIWSPSTYTFIGWTHCTKYVTKDGVRECEMHMNVDRVNPAPTAEFGYHVSVTVNGNGTVIDNQSPHKIKCVSTAGNITVCNAAYSNDKVAFTATSNNVLTDPFVSWKNSDVCTSSSSNVCALGSRCAATNLVANFNQNTIVSTQPSCSVVPNNGTAPLVLKLNTVNGQSGNTYKFTITTPSGGVDTVNQPNGNAVYYTAASEGTYAIALSNSAGNWTTNCPSVTVNNPNVNTGGEVAP